MHRRRSTPLHPCEHLRQGSDTTIGDKDMHITTNQAAEIAGVSRWTVVRWIKAGRLKAVKPSGRGQWRVNMADMDAFMRGRVDAVAANWDGGADADAR